MMRHGYGALTILIATVLLLFGSPAAAHVGFDGVLATMASSPSAEYEFDALITMVDTNPDSNPSYVIGNQHTSDDESTMDAVLDFDSGNADLARFIRRARDALPASLDSL